MLWRAISEDEPGPKWAGLFAEYWPHYKRWWLKHGEGARPTYAEGCRALKQHMPEIVPLYENLCELAGGSDLAARFLSFHNPPPYLSGCSQAIWPGREPVLVRNYDYSPKAFDSLILKTGWQGRQVIGTSDGLFGLVDGMHDAGLSISLTFGGRRIAGDGFGVPLILRYVLQTCKTADEAGEALARIPTHMSYNVTVLDKKRRYLTAMMGPDRPAAITTIMVSPIARDTASRMPPTMPGSAAGRSTLRMVSFMVAPMPRDASRRVSGTALIMSSDRDITKGMIMMPMTSPAARALSDATCKPSDSPSVRMNGATVRAAKKP